MTAEQSSHETAQINQAFETVGHYSPAPFEAGPVADALMEKHAQMFPEYRAPSADRNTWQEAAIGVLAHRYEAVQAEMNGVQAQTPAEAAAATNYFRGRVDELNAIRETIASEAQEQAVELPNIDRESVQIGYQEVEDPQRAIGISM